MTQQIRLSQYVVTYGPGALLGGRQGPRVIPQPDIGMFSQRSGLHAPDYEISDQRMSKGLLNSARIFRLPSNAELQIPQIASAYRTRPFPDWRLCLNRTLHTGDFSVLFARTACPVCNVSDPRTQEGIRFITACSEGHMDDVDWIQLVHSIGASCQHTGWLQWQGGGSAIGDIEVICPRCKTRQNFGNAYGQSWPCTGRYPEREQLNSKPVRLSCSRPSRIIQRQASNLRIPDLKTLFAVQPRHTELHNLLETTPIYIALAASGGASSIVQLRTMLDNLVQMGVLAGSIREGIIRYPWTEIEKAIKDILTPISSTYHDLILEEFMGLINGSINGVPPVRGPAPISPIVLEINPNLTKKYSGPNGGIIRVVPVLRLRTVTVQKGYRREVDTSNVSTLVDIGFHDPTSPGQLWYPGVEFLGEGIFIMPDADEGWHHPLLGDAAQSWKEASKMPSSYPDYVFPDRKHEELDPVFVWWHTLSHLLIRRISIESGYSIASIRERVYFWHDGSRAKGGILLYATQPGSEGTLGGLVALVPFLQETIASCFQIATSCSADPLCHDTRFLLGKYNGAACYACLLISETSCEHRNMWLDRHVIGESPL